MFTMDDCMLALTRGQMPCEKEVMDLFTKAIHPGSTRHNTMVEFVNHEMECGSWNMCRARIISKMDYMITEWVQEHINAFPIMEARFQKCLDNAILSGKIERAASIRACQAKLREDLGYFKALAPSRIARSQ